MMGRWVFEQRYVAKGTSWAHRWHTLCLNHFRQGIAGAVRAAGAPPTSLSVVFWANLTYVHLHDDHDVCSVNMCILYIYIYIYI